MTFDVNKLPRYQEALTAFNQAVIDGADKDTQSDLYAEAMAVLGEEMVETISTSTEQKAVALFEDMKRNPKMTANEIKFFANLDKEVPGVKNKEVLIPEETYNQVFDELATEHPLLSLINFRNAGIRMKAVTANTEGTAQWGDIYGDIKGQLKQTFKETHFGQNKLTAFVLIPKDALKFSETWLKNFVVTQIKEAMSVALETAIVNGDGKGKPVGLIKDLSKPTSEDEKVVYKTDKTALASLATIEPTTAPKLLAPVMKYLAVTDKGNLLNIEGQVHLLANPADYYDLVAKFTSMNLNGVYTTTLPFGIKITMSKAVKTGTGILFVANRYDGFIGGGVALGEFDQTFALEDLQLITAKSYWYGKAKDNHVAAVVTLVGG